MRKCTWAEEERNSGSIKYQSWVPAYHSRLVQSPLAFCQKHFGNDISFCLVSCSTYFKADVLPPASLTVALNRLHTLNACGSNFSWISNSPVLREAFCLLKMRILSKVMQHWCARLLLSWPNKLKDQFEFCHAWQFSISCSGCGSSLWRKSTQRGRTCKMDTFSSTASWWHSVTRSVTAEASLFKRDIYACNPSRDTKSTSSLCCALIQQLLSTTQPFAHSPQTGWRREVEIE